MVWLTQGTISDRTTERLGTSDKGIILFRQVLLEQMEKVERGEDPLGVIRDPVRNEPMIEIPRESKAHFTFGSETFIKEEEARSMDTFWAQGEQARTAQEAMQRAADASHLS
jgi:5,5'-dehydrodivanillate O-demethylase oxygenase subunit